MQRKYDNKSIVLVKKLMAKGYRNPSILEIMKKEHNLDFKSQDLYGIRKGVSYSDVSSELNDKIMQNTNYVTNKDTKKIEEIKWAIANDYTDNEIMEVFDVSRKELTNIRMCYLPYFLIAPEYNEKIGEKCRRKKRGNIDKKIVIEIKREYVSNNGKVQLKDIASRYNVENSSISNILNLKSYKEFGVSFNSKINRIKNEQKRLLKQKELTAKIKLAHRDKLKKLREKKNILINEIKAQEKILRNACKEQICAKTMQNR